MQSVAVGCCRAGAGDSAAGAVVGGCQRISLAAAVGRQAAADEEVHWEGLGSCTTGAVVAEIAVLAEEEGGELVRVGRLIARIVRRLDAGGRPAFTETEAFQARVQRTHTE
jgi:hypothetical protein